MDDMQIPPTASEAEAKTEAKAEAVNPGVGDLAQTLASGNHGRSKTTLARAASEALLLEAKAKAAATEAETRIAEAKAEREARDQKAKAKEEARAKARARWAARWGRVKAVGERLVKAAADDPYNAYAAFVYLVAVGVAIHSQADTFHKVFGWAEWPWAAAAALFIEGVAVAFAGTRRKLRLAQQGSIAALIGQWGFTIFATFLNFYAHSAAKVAGLPLEGMAVASTSLGAMLLFDMRTSAKIRQVLQDLGQLPPARPVFGLIYALRYRYQWFWAMSAAVASAEKLTRGEAIEQGARMREAKAKAQLSQRLASEAKAAYVGLAKAARKAASRGEGEQATQLAFEAMGRLAEVAQRGLEATAFETARMSPVFIREAEAKAAAAAEAKAEAEIAAAKAEADRARAEAAAQLAAVKAEAEAKLNEAKAALEATRTGHLQLESRPAPASPSSWPTASASPRPKAKAKTKTEAETNARADFGGNVKLEMWADQHWLDRPLGGTAWALRIAALAAEFPGEMGARDTVVMPRMQANYGPDGTQYGMSWTSRGWTSMAMQDLRELRAAGLPDPKVIEMSQVPSQA